MLCSVGGGWTQGQWWAQTGAQKGPLSPGSSPLLCVGQSSGTAPRGVVGVHPWRSIPSGCAPGMLLLGCPHWSEAGAVGPFQLWVLCAGEGCGGVRCLRAPQSHPYNIADVVTAEVQPDTNGTLLTDRGKATAPRPYSAAVLQRCCRYSWRWDTPLGWSWEPRAPLQCSPLLTDPQSPITGDFPWIPTLLHRLPHSWGPRDSLPPSHPTSCLLGRITPA